MNTDNLFNEFVKEINGIPYEGLIPQKNYFGSRNYYYFPTFYPVIDILTEDYTVIMKNSITGFEARCKFYTNKRNKKFYGKFIMMYNDHGSWNFPKSIKNTDVITFVKENPKRQQMKNLNGLRVFQSN